MSIMQYFMGKQYQILRREAAYNSSHSKAVLVYSLSRISYFRGSKPLEVSNVDTVPMKSLSAVFVTASSTTVCNCFYARRASNGKTTTF